MDLKQHDNSFIPINVIAMWTEGRPYFIFSLC